MKIASLPRRFPRIEMVPLIDTFFLILAFFISSVLTMEVVRGLKVELPGAGPSASAVSRDRWVVTLGADGQLELEGQPLSLEELGRRLRVLSGSEIQVAIRADRRAAYEGVVEVLATVKAAGVARVTLLTAPPAERGKASSKEVVR